MRKIIFSSTAFILFFIGSEVSCNGTTKFIFSENFQVDSLILVNNKSDKRIVIPSGKKVKIWQEDNSKIVGDFISVNKDSIILNTHQGKISVSISVLESIKIYSPPGRQLIGKAFVLVGATGMAFGGISLIAGLAALSADSLGAIILVAVPVLAGGGYGIYSLGESLKGNKLDLSDKWSVAKTL